LQICQHWITAKLWQTTSAFECALSKLKMEKHATIEVKFKNPYNAIFIRQALIPEQFALYFNRQ
jgi:hypothetical protein